MAVLAVILALVCLALAFGFYTLEKNLRLAKKQLEAAKKGETGTRIDLDSPNRAAEALFVSINELLDLRGAEEADYRRRERALRQQIANVSHDLRTPLTSILGYLQLLESGTLSEEERKEYLAVVEGRARTLQELIGSFYDLSRIEGGEYPLEREQVDLYRMLSELAAEFYGDFQRAGMAVEVELEKDLPFVWGDGGAVLRILTNLVGNALKHGSKFLTIRLYREGDHLVTSFANDGAGLTQEDVAHVFDRFYTADKTRSGQNTGLGMSIVRALARQMGHEASAELRDGVFTARVLWKLSENQR